MKHWNRMAVLAAFLVALAVTFDVWAQERTLEIDSVENTADLFDSLIRSASLSPDGTMLAADDGSGICILNLETDETACFPFPEAFRSGSVGTTEHNPFVWSPDSRRIVFTESFHFLFYESDLWSLEVSDGSYTNLTDDGVSVSFLEVQTPFTLDYLPAFAPNGDIYFFRSERSEENDRSFTLTLQRLAANADTPQLVADLTMTLPLLSIHFSPAVSPDGSLIVFPVQAQQFDAPENGLWLVNVENGEVRQLTDDSDTKLGLPESDQDTYMQTLHPVWVAAGAGIIFHTVSMTGDGMFLYVDVTTGAVSPVVETDAPEALLLREGAVIADGTALVYLRHAADAETAQIAAAPLPPDGGEPVVMGEVEFTSSPYAVPNPQMSSDNKALLGGWLFVFGQQR